MDSNKRSIIEKIANDSGWNIEIKSDEEDCLKFKNSFFNTAVLIIPEEDPRYSIQFDVPIDLEEIVGTAGVNQKNIEKATVIDNSVIVVDDKLTLQKILFRAAEYIYSQPDNPLKDYQKTVNEELDRIKSSGKILTTEQEITIRQRVGQDTYRKSLMNLWGNSCSVTGCTFEVALKASHAKPWADATDSERLDAYNGFLLTANLDVLFDKGYISFKDTGEIMISSQIPKDDWNSLGINTSLKLRRVYKHNIKYLEYHRQHIWNL